MASQSLIQRSLESYKVKSCGNRTTYLLHTNTLREIGAKRWSRQRPADELRVTEIREWIQTHVDISGVISMAWHPMEHLIVYDGQHRWRALIDINAPVQALVEIMWDATEAEIVESFRAINRSVSVPELYTDPGVTSDSVRADIMDFVAGMSSNHREFLSTTDKPNRPHFNRDRLADELFGIWRDEFQREVPFGKIAGALMLMNQEYDANQLSVPREASRKNPRIYDKCCKHHFWLFAQTGHVNKEHLRATVAKIQ